MQWTDDSGRTYGEEPYGDAGYVYAHGPSANGTFTDTATLPWDAGQSWVTEPAWDAGQSWATEPAWDREPRTPVSEPERPVFVDSSGRRQRRVLRAARLLMIPAGGYVALLLSTLLGGPSISAPFVPRPDGTHPAAPRVTNPDSPSGTGRPAGSANPAAVQASPRPTARKTSGRTAAAATAPRATAGPTAAPTRTTAAPSTSAPVPSSKGRALGSSHKPVK
ncbi:hypothetical protein SRB17_39570 [Streptomyces sp. RB17]|uniref:hypothetical protein n=1 Tax=Streptomyces sp. RB17 TaxID=2585197 RepID=UPI001295A1C2|nr:hypothetical protein [Streptomyces sp. RB17]MQY35961.1 hypothetical protein [Streptomyces sp. RB17]